MEMILRGAGCGAGGVKTAIEFLKQARAILEV
jgi:hypothetical protein